MSTMLARAYTASLLILFCGAPHAKKREAPRKTKEAAMGPGREGKSCRKLRRSGALKIKPMMPLKPERITNTAPV